MATLGRVGGFLITDEKVRKKLSDRMFHAAMENSKWSQFMGTGDDSVIKTQEELGIEEGASVIMRFRGLVRGEGITGDTEFSGNEDNLPYLKQKVEVELIGNSLKSEGRLSRQRDAINFRADATEGLTDWATNKMDKIIYNRMSTNPTNRLIAGTKDDNNVANLTNASVFTTADISHAKYLATRGFKTAGAGNPLVAAHRIPPFKAQSAQNGGLMTMRKFYVLKVGSQQANDLRQDTDWIQAQRELGLSNLQFTSMLGIWEDVIVIEDGTEHTDYAGIIESDNGAVYYENALFLGRTAMLMPMDGNLQYWEDEVDMGRKMAVGVDWVFGLSKTKFEGTRDDETDTSWHNQDFGGIVISSYARDV